MSELTEYLDGHLKVQQQASELIEKEVGLKVMHKYLTTEECIKFVNAMNTSFRLKRFDTQSDKELEVIEKLKQLIEIRKNKEIV